MALLELIDLHVALEDGTEIVKGVDLAVDTNEVHAVMGPNGSAGLKVTSRRRSTGSGRSSQWIRCAWNAYVKAKQTMSASSETVMRARSSPRCSTRVASSPG